MTLDNNKFLNNYASTMGGAIFASDFIKFDITNSYFEQNGAENFGGDIYAQYSDNNLTIQNSKILNQKSLNSIYLEQIAFRAH